MPVCFSQRTLNIFTACFCGSSVEVLNILYCGSDKVFNHIPSEGMLFVMKSETFIV